MCGRRAKRYVIYETQKERDTIATNHIPSHCGTPDTQPSTAVSIILVKFVLAAYIEEATYLWPVLERAAITTHSA